MKSPYTRVTQAYEGCAIYECNDTILIAWQCHIHYCIHSNLIWLKHGFPPSGPRRLLNKLNRLSPIGAVSCRAGSYYASMMVTATMMNRLSPIGAVSCRAGSSYASMMDARGAGVAMQCRMDARGAGVRRFEPRFSTRLGIPLLSSSRRSKLYLLMSE